ncbi:MAG: hypothetical protein WAN36_06505 [Calditrichia bacterium]
MVKLCGFLLMGLILFGCSNSKLVENNKMDAPLKNKISELEKSNDQEVIQVFGKCGQKITDAMKDQLKSTGADIGSTAGDIFTASGKSPEIRKLAQLDIVTQLSLTATSKPITN